MRRNRQHDHQNLPAHFWTGQAHPANSDAHRSASLCTLRPSANVLSRAPPWKVLSGWKAFLESCVWLVTDLLTGLGTHPQFMLKAVTVSCVSWWMTSGRQFFPTGPEVLENVTLSSVVAESEFFATSSRRCTALTSDFLPPCSCPRASLVLPPRAFCQLPYQALKVGGPIWGGVNPSPVPRLAGGNMAKDCSAPVSLVPTVRTCL